MNNIILMRIHKASFMMRTAKFHAMVVDSAKTAKAKGLARTAEISNFQTIEELPRQDPLANVVSFIFSSLAGSE